MFKKAQHVSDRNEANSNFEESRLSCILTRYGSEVSSLPWSVEPANYYLFEFKANFATCSIMIKSNNTTIMLMKALSKLSFTSAPIISIRAQIECTTNKRTKVQTPYTIRIHVGYGWYQPQKYIISSRNWNFGSKFSSFLYSKFSVKNSIKFSTILNIFTLDFWLFTKTAELKLSRTLFFCKLYAVDTPLCGVLFNKIVQ